jgi:hypothetical protein
MISSYTDKTQVGRYYTGALFATTLIMTVTMVTSLLGLWKLSIIEPDLKLRVIGFGMMGVTAYLATILNLWRLRRKLGRAAL